MSNFAHSIHLVTSGDVAPRAHWCAPLTIHFTLQNSHSASAAGTPSALAITWAVLRHSHAEFLLPATRTIRTLSFHLFCRTLREGFIYNYCRNIFTFSRALVPSCCKIYEQNAASVIRFPISAIRPFFLRIASPAPEVGSCCSGGADGCYRFLMSSRAFASPEWCRGSLHVGNFSDDYRLVRL